MARRLRIWKRNDVVGWMKLTTQANLIAVAMGSLLALTPLAAEPTSQVQEATRRDPYYHRRIAVCVGINSDWRGGIKILRRYVL